MNQAVHQVTHPSSVVRRLPQLRRLLQELSHIEKRQDPDAKFAWRKSPLFVYTRSGPHEGLGESTLEHYCTLLKALRCNREVQEKYKGVGERSVEETAKMVGLRMPTLYKDPNDT